MNTKIVINEKENGYDTVEKVVLNKYGCFNESIVVQLKTKFNENEKWDEHTELLLNDGDDYRTPKWVWENDWWEGQKYIEVIKASPVSRVKLDDYIKGEWINVNDRLPDLCEPVLCAIERTDNGKMIYTLDHINDETGNFYIHNTLDLVKYWMPLPPLPRAR